jgi:DNA-binding transcriptional LysR family regulator
VGSVSQLDWNLIPMLATLLRERNVSRAARQLGVSQPTASGALARLRRHFDDQLLVRSGHKYELTELAAQLLPLAELAESSVRDILEGAQVFDPAVERREFVLAMSDYAQLVFARPLLALAARQAPGVTFRVQTLRPGPLSVLQEAVASSDGLVLPRGVLPSQPAVELFDDRWVCVVDRADREVGDVLSTRDAARSGWVALVLDPSDPTPQIREAATLGVPATVEALADSYSSIPFLVSGTRRIGYVQERLALLLAESSRTRVVEAPWPAQTLRFALWTNPVKRHDPGQRWIHTICDAVGSGLRGQQPPAVLRTAPSDLTAS